MTNTENNESKSIYPRGTYICPICGKEFEANDDTRYIIRGGYSCSWDCFLTECKKGVGKNDIEEKLSKRKKIRGG